MTTLKDVSDTIRYTEIRGVPAPKPELTAEQRAEAYCAKAPPNEQGQKAHYNITGTWPDQVSRCVYCKRIKIEGRIQEKSNTWYALDRQTDSPGPVRSERTKQLQDEVLALRVGESVIARHDHYACVLKPTGSVKRCSYKAMLQTLRSPVHGYGHRSWSTQHTEHHVAIVTRTK